MDKLQRQAELSCSNACLYTFSDSGNQSDQVFTTPVKRPSNGSVNSVSQADSDVSEVQHHNIVYYPERKVSYDSIDSVPNNSQQEEALKLMLISWLS